MKIEPSGVILTDVCEVQTAACVAREPAPITAVWASPGRRQVNVCRPCLEEKVRRGDWEIPGARLPRRYDAAVYSPSGQLQVIVEVGTAVPSGEEDATAWARRVHRNLGMHAGLGPASYFLLVGYPGHFFAWRGPAVRDAFAPPDHVLHDPGVLRPYRPAGRAEDERSERAAAEGAVAAWLGSLTNGDPPPDAPGGEWLVRSGLLDAIRGGTVVRQVARAA